MDNKLDIQAMLASIFRVFNFNEQEIQAGTKDFSELLGGYFLKNINEGLSEEEKESLKAKLQDKSQEDQSKILEEELKNKYSPQEIQSKTAEAFTQLFVDYLNGMMEKANDEQKQQLRQILESNGL